MSTQVTKSIIVKGAPRALYAMWSDFESFPRFMKPVKRVVKTGDRTSHWIVEGPLGRTIEWDAEATRLEENKRIAWKSTGGDVKTSGQVTFNRMPHHATEITVTLQYSPQGKARDVADRLFGGAEKLLEENLRRFKTWAENGATPS